MLVADFDFDLPPERIAQAPASPRDAARLLAIPKLCDLSVRDLPGLLRPGDVLVVNDTRVIPARLFGRRGDARVEAMLHKAEGLNMWRAFARPGRRIRVGDEITFADGFTARVEAKGAGGEVTLRFNRTGADLIAAIETHGVMPLPPYIKRESEGLDTDRDDYQTVFARAKGAVAAPTAGLHFTPELLRTIERAGVGRVTVTLHVGAGTFLPVKAEAVADHVMHAEWGEVTAPVAAAVNAARAAGGRVVAVGTTALRLLESAADQDGTLHPFSGETDIFIVPGYRFRIVDALMTNFHLPRSTLFMLVSAFAGLAPMKAAYAHAVASGYRFYSYGDACFIERGEGA